MSDTRGLGVSWNYEHPDLGDDPREDPSAYADKALSHDVFRTLMLHYPANFWHVASSHKAGMVKIHIRGLMSEDEVMAIRIKELETDPSFTIVVRMGGEILERFGITRCGRRGFTERDFDAALKAHPLGYRGGGSRGTSVPG